MTSKATSIVTTYKQKHIMGATTGTTVRVVSGRMVQPPSGGGGTPSEDIHLTPWDLRLLTIYYIQMGIVLPKPPVGGKSLVDALASSLARTLVRYYHFAGRLAVEELGDGTVTVSLRCTGEGAELVHAEAPGVAVADLVGSVHTSSPVDPAFFSLSGVLNGDAAIQSLPVLSAQVTELADGVFIAVSMNHSVGDGTNFWDLFNTWSEIHRGGDVNNTTPLLHGRWFVETSPVPIPLPLSKLQHVLQRFHLPPVREAFFTFSAASVKKLKARANEEMATNAISSLQALLAHLWRAVCRARRVPKGQETFYVLATWAAPWWSEERTGTVASFDEATLREFLDRWIREPTFPYSKDLSAGGGLEISNSPLFDVFGNDFGWGRPLGVRSGFGADDKSDGKATVFEGPEGEGSMSLEVCLAPDVLERLLADHEFMDAVTLPLPA
uniref:Putative acetyltransferase n=1 Tax=Aegilops tauschii TaxID=37682 RepID=M8BZ19_AEGTA